VEPIQQVRLLIPDRGDSPVFTDEELQFLLSEHNDNPRLAAADALEIIAGDPQRVQQYSRGGVSAAKASSAELMARAQRLREQAKGGMVVGTIVRPDFWEGS